MLRFATAISSGVSSDLCEFSPITFYHKIVFLVRITSITKSTIEVFWSIFHKGFTKYAQKTQKEAELRISNPESLIIIRGLKSFFKTKRFISNFVIPYIKEWNESNWSKWIW